MQDHISTAGGDQGLQDPYKSFKNRLDSGSLTYVEFVNSIMDLPGWEWTERWWQQGCLVLAADNDEAWEQKAHGEIAPRNTVRAGCSGHDRKGRLAWVGWDLDVQHGGQSYETFNAALEDAYRIREVLEEAEIRRSKSGDGIHIKYLLPEDSALTKEDGAKIAKYIAQKLKLKADPSNLGRQVFWLWQRDCNGKGFLVIEEQEKLPLDLPDIIEEALNSKIEVSTSKEGKEATNASWSEYDVGWPSVELREELANNDWPEQIDGQDHHWGTPQRPRSRRGNRNWDDITHLCNDWGLPVARAIEVIVGKIRHGLIDESEGQWKRMLSHAKYPRGWKLKKAGYPTPEDDSWCYERSKTGIKGEKADGKQEDAAPADGTFRPPIPMEPYSNVPAFPTKVLPRPLAQYCQAVADSAECPVDLVGQTMLAATSTTMNPKAEVDWGKREPLGLYLLTASAPSEHKSTVEGGILSPLRTMETMARKHAKLEIDRAKAERDVLALKLENAKKEAAKNPSSEYKVRDLVGKLQAFEVPRDPRLTIEDITPETLASRLSEHGCLAILSSEGGIVDNLSNRYSKANNANYKLYLKAWSGDPHQVDRQDREEVIERPLLTIGVICQPESFQEIIENVRGARKLGLLSRFLFSVPTSLVGDRTLAIRPVPQQIEGTWGAALSRLMALKPGTIILSADAREIQRQYALALERRIGPGGDLEHIADWIGKVQRGQTSRIAALLHVLEVENPYGIEVSADTMKRALALSQYYLCHAKKAFEMFKSKPEEVDVSFAKRLVTFCADKQRITYGDLTRRFKSPKRELEPTMEWLSELGYVTRDSKGKSAFLVNPLQPESDEPEETINFNQVEDLPKGADVPVATGAVHKEEQHNAEEPTATQTVNETESKSETVDLDDGPSHVSIFRRSYDPDEDDEEPTRTMVSADVLDMEDLTF